MEKNLGGISNSVSDVPKGWHEIAAENSRTMDAEMERKKFVSSLEDKADRLHKDMLDLERQNMMLVEEIRRLVAALHAIVSLSGDSDLSDAWSIARKAIIGDEQPKT